MKEMIDRIQNLGRKAAELKQAVASAPGHVAEMRQAVALTAGQLQQLRSDVQVNVAGLRATDGARVVGVLKELVGETAAIRAAGYVLGGVELEVDPVSRVFLLLDKVEDVSGPQLQALLAAQATHPAVHGLITALVQAEELSDGLVLPGLSYQRVRVEVGPVPTLRLCWQATGAVSPPSAMAATAATSKSMSASSSTSPALPSMFGEGSFFERRPAVVATPASVRAAPDCPAPAPSPAAPAVEKSRASALDRFKKMPDLGRRPN